MEGLHPVAGRRGPRAWGPGPRASLKKSPGTRDPGSRKQQQNQRPTVREPLVKILMPKALREEGRECHSPPLEPSQDRRTPVWETYAILAQGGALTPCEFEALLKNSLICTVDFKRNM